MKKTAPQTFYDLIQKPTAILLLSVFLPTQTFTVYASPIDPASLTGDPGRETSSVNTSEAASSEAKTQANLSEPLDTGNFLSQDNPLREKTEAERSNRYAEDVGVRSQVASDYALAEVDNDVAVAGILAEPLSADDFKASALNRHEAAHMVIDGQVVYSTTGRATEILLHPAAFQLLAAAASEGRVSAIYHNHPMGQNPEPSLADIAAAKNFPGNLKFYSYGYNARGQFEAYAFNGDGVLNKDKPMSAEALAGEMNASVSAGAVSMETREFLSEFIAAVDYYNESKIDARELFSQGPTVFPGYPTLGSFASSSPSATVSVGQSSTELFGMAYNVSNAGSFVGSYMDFGVTTPADLSGFSNFIFEMRTDNINASGNQVKVEFVDTSNRRGVAFISGLNGTMKQIEILPEQLTGADLTRIKQIIFVVDSGMAAAKPNGFIEIRTGGLDYNPAIGPVSNPDAYPVTPLPNKSNRERVSANGFASPDGSSTQVNLASSTFMTLTYNGLAADSYGGVFMSYDDPETAGIPDSETINLAAAYPVGITLSLDNANTGLNSVVLEISDNRGNVDFVTLTNIEGFGKKWVIPTSLFDRIDITKVAIISLVVTGRARDKKLNVDWGNFYRDPIVAPVPDPDNYSISPLPKKSDGARPSLSKFASSDGTRMDLSQLSSTFLSLNYNGASAESFGGFFIGYDDPSTVGIPDAETINLKSLFPDPNGLTFVMDDGGSALNEAFLEFTDKFGVRGLIQLTSIESFGKKWSISRAVMNDLEANSGIDLSKVAVVALFVKGSGAAKLNLDWGQFLFTPSLRAVTNPDAYSVTPLPKRSSGLAPAPSTFVSSDSSSIKLHQSSSTFLTLEYHGTSVDSFGGFFVSYDDPATAGIPDNETINVKSFSDPNGLVLMMDNGANALSEVTLEFTDKNGRRASIRLIDIEGFGKKWSLSQAVMSELEQAFGVDLTRVAFVSIVMKGRAANAKLNLDWGQYLYDPVAEITADPVTDFSIQQPVLGILEPCAVLGQSPCEATLDTVPSFNQPDNKNVNLDFDLRNGADAGDRRFAGAILSFGNQYASAETPIVLGLKGTGQTNGELKLLFEDFDGTKVTVRVKGLTENVQNFKVTKALLDSALVAGFDASRIATIVVLADAATARSSTASGSIQIRSNGLQFTPVAESTNDSVTDFSQLEPSAGEIEPCSVIGQNPCRDGTLNIITNFIQTLDSQLNFDFDLSQGSDEGFRRFGGALLNFGANTLDVSNPVVLGLKASGTAKINLVFEDINGKQVTVRAENITNSARNFKITKTLLESAGIPDFDPTHIAVIVAVIDDGLSGSKTSKGSAQINTKGLAFTKELTNDPAKGEGDITLLPLLVDGERVKVGGFAKADTSSALISDVNERFAKLTYTGAKTDSFGGIALDYTGSEFDFGTKFPNGVVLRLDSPNVTSVLFELTDISGKRDQVRLVNLEGFGKYYVIKGSDFFNIDLTKIKTVAFVFEGLGVKTLNVGWGRFDETKELTNDPAKGEGDITLLPLLVDGERVKVGGFAKADTSSALISDVNERFAKLTYTGAKTDSFGGIALDYTGSEFDFGTKFPNGVVLRLDSPNVTSVLFELTDISGKRDQVRLVNLEGFGKYYVIKGSDFFNIDLTKIKTVAFVFEGLGVKTLNVGWGRFDETKELTNDPAKGEGDITLLPLLVDGERVKVGGFAKADTSSALISDVNERFAKLTYTGAKTDSFGGIALDYTGSEFDFGTKFPNGVVLRLDSPNVTSVLFELTDISGKRDQVRLVNLEGFGKYYVIKGSDFFNIDLTKIKTVAFVFEGLGVKTLNVGWGRFDETKELTNDPAKGEGDITLLPLLVDGERVKVGGFAKADTSSALISDVNERFAKLTYTGAKTDSFGGIALDYTGSEFDFGTKFPNGVVLRLDSPNVTSVLFELTDISGKRDQVRLVNLEGFGKYYVIKGSDFFNIDLTKIKTVAFVFEGLGVKTLNVGWGRFDETKELTNDPAKGEGDITLLPLLVDGERVKVGGFAKADTSSALISDVNERFAKLTYTGAKTDSFGGIALDYTGSEFDFGTKFPNGVVLRLDSPNVTSVLFELTDISGKRDQVRLVNLEGFGKYYVIKGSDFFNIDLTKIKTVAFVFEGLGVKTLNVGWGRFDETKELTNDPAKGEGDITLLPLLVDGERVKVGGFAKADTSSALISDVNERFAKLTYTGAKTDSFGGIALDYTGSEFDFGTKFPNGVVLRLDSPNVTSVLFELTDISGKRDQVRLVNLEGFGKYYVIKGSDFFNIDLTKIKTVAFVFEGLGVKTLNVGWGRFDETKELTNDPAKGEGDITLLPLLVDGERVKVGGFAKADTSSALISDVNERFAKLTYTGAKTDSFGGIALDYTGSEFDFGTKFPNGVVLRLDSPNVTSVLFELTDISGKRDQVRLVNLEGFGKYYVIKGSDFFNIDLTKIKTVAFVFEGLGVKTLNVGWGRFDETKELTNDPAKGEGDITLLPLLVDGERVKVGGFAKADTSSALISDVNERFAKLTYTGAKTDSFGGIALDYTGSEFDFGTKFPNGVVLRLDSPNVTSVLFELTDISGKRDQVRLVNLEGFGKYYVIKGSDFFNIDLTKIKTVAFVFEGLGVKTLNVGWGRFDETKELTNDPAKGEGDITLLPLLVDGERVKVGGFAKADTSSALISDVNERFAKLTYTGAKTDSFGGIALDYTGSEFDFGTKFPNGVVLRLDSPNVTSVLFELTDISGKRDQVRLVNLEGFGKYYVIKGSDFFNIDLTKIKTVAFVFEGLGVKTLNVGWGRFDETKELTNDPAKGEGDITLLPLLVDGERVKVGGFAKADTSSALISDVNERFAKLTYTGAKTDSFGGIALDYTGSEFDFGTKFPNGVVLRLDSPNVTSVLFELTDISGKRDQVRLVNLEGFGKYYVIKGSDFFNIDLTKIKTVAFVFEGLGVKTLNVGWGRFDETKELTNDPAKGEGDITLLPLLVDGERVKVGGFAKADTSSALISDVNERFAKLTYTGAKTDSFGGIALDYTGSEFDFGTKFPNGVVLRLDSPNVTSVLFELTDISGKRDQVRLVNLEGFGKYYVIKGSDFFNIDLTKIKTVAFVFEGLGVKTLNVGWGLFGGFIPEAIETSDPLSDFGLERPAVSELEPCSIIGQNPCTAGTLNTVTDLNQDSADHFSFNFDLANGDDVEFRRFGGVLVNFGAASWDASRDIVLEFKGGAAATTKLKLDFVDVKGKKVTVSVDRLTGAYKRYKISRALLESPGIIGFDATKIAVIAIVADPGTAGSSTASGKFDINTKGLKYTPVGGGDPFDPALHTVLPGMPGLRAAGGNTIPNRVAGFITQTQTSDKDFKFNYDVAVSQTAFVFSQIAFDQTGQSLPENLILGLKGPSAAAGMPAVKLRVEFEDSDGTKFASTVTLQSDFKNYTFALSGASVPAAFDRTKVRYITFVMDRQLASGINKGTIEIKTAGLMYLPVYDGAAYNSALHTLLPDQPRLSAAGGNTIPNRVPGFITQVQNSDKSYQFNYDLGGSQTAFVFSQIVLNQAGSSLPQNVTLGVKGPNGIRVKVEIEDVNGKKVINYLNLKGEFKNYALSLSGSHVPAGFDRSKIRYITLVLDRGLVGAILKNTVEVATAGLFYTPVINGTGLDEREHTLLPNMPVLSASGGNTVAGSVPGFITQNQLSNKNFAFNYDLTGSKTAFVFSQIRFNKGPVALPASVTLAAKGPAGVKMKVEIQDANGLRIFNTLILDGNMRNYALNLQGGHVPSGFDLQKIAHITFVLDQDLAKADLQDRVEIMTNGLFFEAMLNGEVYDPRFITGLSGSPKISAAGSNIVVNRLPGSITLKQNSSDEFEYVYNLQASQTSTVVTKVDFGNSPQSLPENFVLAARGGDGSQTRVEIIDSAGVKAAFILNLRPAYQNYTLSLNELFVPAGFDRQRISQILFVQDRSRLSKNLNDVVKIRLDGVSYTPEPALPADLLAVKSNLISKGLSFFKANAGLDPVTHMPYDAANLDGTIDDAAKFTQPTLIGFYMQMLGHALQGKLDIGLTTEQILTEIEFLTDQLLDLQTRFGWKGLLPFMQLTPQVAPLTTDIGIGDNLNLIQSLAVMMGSIENVALSQSNQTKVAAIVSKTETFIDRQEEGYRASVNPTFGLLHNAYNTQSREFVNFLDRTAVEFRGAIAFAAVRYASLPKSIWDNLASPKVNYKDRNGISIQNLATYDGSAFQMVWPLLRNNEMDFIGFRNALHNQFVSQADFAVKYRIPGFLSAAEIPENFTYVGDLGIRDLSETSFPEITADVGSTYALASAYSIAPKETLSWLKAIGQISNVNGIFGYVDSARSSSETAKRFLGIDIASTVLGLLGASPSDFEAYMRSRGKELAYNLLYDRKDDGFQITKTSAAIPVPPEFPDRTLSVFRNTESIGTINDFPVDNTYESGVHYQYGQLSGGFGGQVFNLNKPFDAAASQLVMQYSVLNSPKQLKFEFKDASDNKLFEVTKNLVDSTPGLSVEKLVIDFPNQTALSNVRKVVLVIDQNATGDTSGDFIIHSMVFQHLASAQTLKPKSGLSSSQVTVLPGNPPAQLISSSAQSSIERISSRLTKLNYDVAARGFAGISINFDPQGNSQGANLSNLSRIVFGIDSAKVKKARMEIDDHQGRRAVFYLDGISATRGYYEFLTAVIASSIDLTKVKRINFVADSDSVLPGDESGSLTLELAGLLVP